MLFLPYMVAKKSLGWFFLVFFLSCLGWAQELPPIQNFTPLDYDGENQNWSIAQRDNGQVYVANNNNLLEYNGEQWRKYLSPNGSVIRSLYASGENVYSGCYMEFGYWKTNGYGELEYTSLSSSIKEKLLEDEQFWNITQIGNWVLFQSLSRIYSYDLLNNSFDIIEAKTAKAKVFTIGDDFYVHSGKSGLYMISNRSLTLVNQSEELTRGNMVGVFEADDKVLLIMEDASLLELDDRGGVAPYTPSFLQLPKDVSIYNSVQLYDGTLVIGTISHGIYQIDFESEEVNQINRDRGLNNNTVLALFQDSGHNLWLGLDNGLSVINLKTPFREFTDSKGQLGVVSASIWYDNMLYLGTNQGLFVSNRTREGSFKFELLAETKGQVWNLSEIDGVLFCAHNKGTFQVKGDKTELISELSGTWGVKKVPTDDDLLLQGNYDGLSLLKRKENGEGWEFFKKLEGFSISSRFFEFLTDDIIVVNHEYKGVYVLQVDGMEVLRVLKRQEHYGYGSSLSPFEEDLKYATNEGVFSVLPQTFEFNPDTLLTSFLFTENYQPKGIMISDAKNGAMWSFTNSGVLRLMSGKFDDRAVSEHISLPKFVINSLGVAGFENITHLYDDTYLIGISNGYITMNMGGFAKREYGIQLKNVFAEDKNEGTMLLDLSGDNELPATFNDLILEFGVPQYQKYVEVLYQYSLDGLDGTWSNWSDQARIELNNLDAGNYDVVIRAAINGNVVSTSEGIRFNIARAWYQSYLAIGVYIVMGLLLLYAIHKRNEAMYKKRQKILMKENEEKMRRKRIKAKKKIVQLRNEKLRGEIETKNRELAAATMNIIKKNEFLSHLKKELNDIGENTKIKSVIRTIDRNLNNKDDWKEFEKAFNNADKNFLHKIKEMHPDLTSNDLRLCAYLRLNLSSKEIAPLLNISVRSVEVKRYRLRKKMGLEHENSLTDHILAI